MQLLHPFLLPALITLSIPAAAHTTLETPTMSEGIRVVNNVMVGHACGNGTSVIGTSVVFPDGSDSTILVNGQPYSGPLTDFVSNWGPNIQPLVDRSVFTHADEKNGPNGNVVGLWAGGGEGMPNHMVGYVPFRVNATVINPVSCATSVRFQVSIVDVCKITPAAQLHDEGVAEFWTSNTLATVYDNKESESSARLTFTRNLTTNPLPAACGAGSSVEVRVSPAQLQRDMPIRLNGVQLWPK
ncbi:MAG: hypothetical protein V4603_17490 [Pseudomonadota bacterium]